jgi:hypothetical protein
MRLYRLQCGSDVSSLIELSRQARAVAIASRGHTGRRAPNLANRAAWRQGPRRNKTFSGV